MEGEHAEATIGKKNKENFLSPHNQHTKEERENQELSL